MFNISIATMTEMAKDMRDLKENPEQLALPGVADASNVTPITKASGTDG